MYCLRSLLNNGQQLCVYVRVDVMCMCSGRWNGSKDANQSFPVYGHI